MELVRGDAVDSDYPAELGAFLNRLVADRDGLRVYLLSWDFSMIYTFEREFFPRYKLKWLSHKQIHFHLDGSHPLGASQHQKIVVVDDAVAFVGGFDLSKWRWDTPAHRPDDDRRRDPDGKPYPPFHDIQMIVDGNAAETVGPTGPRTLGTRATLEDPIVAEGCKKKRPLAPPALNRTLKKSRLAVALTHAHLTRINKSVCDIEQLYLDSIAAARPFHLY